jgi:hypothetical protein
MVSRVFKKMNPEKVTLSLKRIYSRSALPHSHSARAFARQRFVFFYTPIPTPEVHNELQAVIPANLLPFIAVLCPYVFELFGPPAR